MNPTPEIRQVFYAYMLDTAPYHTDPRTGEVNCTRLAEDAANHFGPHYAHLMLFEPDADSDECEWIAAEWIFDLAVDVERDIIEGDIDAN